MRRMRIALRGSLYTVLALGLCLAPLGLSGSARTAHAEEERISIKVGAEDMLIEDFLVVVSRATGKNLVWNPADKNIRGKKIMGSVALEAKKSELFPLVRSLLTFYELVMIPVGPEGSKIVLVLDARQTSSILKLKPEYVTLTPANLAQYEHADGLFITCAIPMEHMQDLRNARNALTRIVTGQNIGNVTEVPSAKTFVVTDFAPNVVAIYRLLKKMDVPSASASTTTGETETIKLQHGTAIAMAAVLQQHFAARRSAPSGGRTPRAPVVLEPNAPRVTADARTNMILVTGTAEQISKVKDVVARLDVSVQKPRVQVSVQRVSAPQVACSAHHVRLKHVQAQEMAQALQQFIASSPGIWGRNDRPSVVSHRETNSLLISASAKAFREVATLIAEMDVAPPSEDEKK